MDLGSSILLLPLTAGGRQQAEQAGSAFVPVDPKSLRLDICALYLRSRRSRAIDDFVDALAEAYAG
jgi:broad specificity phosphatase PhoE